MILNLSRHLRLPVTIAALSLYINLCMAQVSSTTITEWQYGKNGAISITYDDASRNQGSYILYQAEPNTANILLAKEP